MSLPGLEAFVKLALGRPGDPASSTGSVQAKLAYARQAMPLVILSIGPFGIGVELAVTSPSESTVAWSAANRAIFVPFRVTETFTAIRISLRTEFQSGNLDVGIYDSSLNRKVSSGSTPCPAAGATVAIAIASTVLPPGQYYMAVAFDNATAGLRAVSGPTAQGVYGTQYQNAAFPLPATAAFSGSSQWPIPVLGVSSTANVGP